MIKSILKNKKVNDYYEEHFPITVDIKKAQIKDMEALLIIATGKDNIVNALYYIFTNRTKFSRFTNNTDVFYMSLIMNDFLLLKFKNYKNENISIIKIDISLYNYKNTIELENIHGMAEIRDNLFSNHTILGMIYLNNFKNLKEMYDDPFFLYDENEDESLQMRIKQNNALLIENDVEDILELFLDNILSGKLPQNSIKGHILKNPPPKTNTLTVLDNVISEYVKLFKFERGFRMELNKYKLDLLNNYYGNLKDYIEDELKEKSSELVRSELNMNKQFWRYVVKFYNIKLPEKIYNDEGIEFDSKDELKIDNFFYQNNVTHYKISRDDKLYASCFHDKKTNKNYRPDWMINNNIIVEYFGYLKRNSTLYAKATLRKSEYFGGLLDYHFIALYPEDLENMGTILHKLTPFLNSY